METIAEHADEDTIVAIAVGVRRERMDMLVDPFAGREEVQDDGVGHHTSLRRLVRIRNAVAAGERPPTNQAPARRRGPIVEVLVFMQLQGLVEKAFVDLTNVLDGHADVRDQDVLVPDMLAADRLHDPHRNLGERGALLRRRETEMLLDLGEAEEVVVHQIASLALDARLTLLQAEPQQERLQLAIQFVLPREDPLHAFLIQLGAGEGPLQGLTDLLLGGRVPVAHGLLPCDIRPRTDTVLRLSNQKN